VIFTFSKFSATHSILFNSAAPYRNLARVWAIINILEREKSSSTYASLKVGHSTNTGVVIDTFSLFREQLLTSDPVDTSSGISNIVTTILFMQIHWYVIVRSSNIQSPKEVIARVFCISEYFLSVVVFIQ